jgi:hypothetical protein
MQKRGEAAYPRRWRWEAYEGGTSKFGQLELSRPTVEEALNRRTYPATVVARRLVTFFVLAPRRRLRFLPFFSRLGRCRLTSSLGASWPALSPRWVCQFWASRLWSNRMLLRRRRKVYNRGSLSSSGGRRSYMKGCKPGVGNRPSFVIIILGPVS